MTTIPAGTLSLFYCYAHEDAGPADVLDKHLKILRQLGWIQSRSNHDIGAGMNWKEEINTCLRTADIILILVSADFISSDYYDDVMQEAVSRHSHGDAVVIPVLLRPVNWEDTPLGTLRVLPSDGKPVTLWDDLDAALLDVATGIRQVVKALLKWVSIFFAPDDFVLAEQLKGSLEERGLIIKSIDDKPQDTVEREEAVRQLIRSSQAVLLVISPYSRSLRYVLRVAEMYKSCVVPIWVAGDTGQTFLSYEWSVVAPIDARGDRYERAIEEIVKRVTSYTIIPSITSYLVPAQAWEVGSERRNPYKGLRAFRSDEAGDFFGRDKLVQDLSNMVREALVPDQQGGSCSRLLTVVGPSGSGKSSLVMAGLLPQLQKEVLDRRHEWVYLDPIVPGAHPIEALAMTLAQKLPEMSLTALQQDLAADTARGLHMLACRIAQRAGTKVVLFVDQFEELFTQTASEEERELFIDVLTTAVTEPYSPVVAVLTLRADFYGHLMAYPVLSSLMRKRQMHVLAMDLRELRAVIEQPAMLPDVQSTFEGDLVGDLLFEVQGQVGALPLLQFTLEQLFEQRDEYNQLTLQAYQNLGGVKGALTKHVESTYTALPSEEHREAARMLFMRLIDPGMTEQDTTRRRASLSEFLLHDPLKTRLLQETIEAFIKARLLTTNEIAGVTTLEVCHEALIREWKRLADWLREAREDIPVQQTISRDAAAWQHSGKPGKRLYQGSQLKQARNLAKRSMLSTDEMEFLQAGIAQKKHHSIIITAAILVTLLTMSTVMVVLLQINTISQTTVTALGDNGLGSLRQVLITAPSGSTITFDKSLKGTIELTSDDLNISRNLTIQGPGADILSIRSGTGGHSINVLSGASVAISGLSFRDSTLTGKEFIFNQGKLVLTNSSIVGNTANHSITNAGTLTVTNCIIRGNTAVGHHGGGISNTGTLALIGSIVSGNTTSGQVGGGVSNDGGTLMVSNSIVTGNRAFGSNGGGIANTGRLTLTGSTVAGNIATSGYGGGIFNDGGTVQLISSTVSENISNDGNGGGIANTGILTLNNSTVASNISNGGNGGGIAHNAARPDALTLINSTISGNKASHGERYGGYGGGIFTESGQPSITFSTVYDNTATDAGGGIAIENSQENKVNHLVMGESIVASNHALSAPDISGILISSGYNLLQNASGTSISGSYDHDITGIAAKIGPLQNNGGSTQTHAVLPGSQTIDQIPLSICRLTGVVTDQRGVKRPQGAACDIGAYEYTAS